jgi:Cu2+-exporting ATPase
MINILFGCIALTYTGIKLHKSSRKENILKNEKKSDSETVLADPRSISDIEKKTSYDETIKKNVKQDFIISSIALGLITVGSLIYPPLIFAGITGLAYVTIPIWKKGYYSAFKQHKLNMSVLDSIALPGIFITGHYFIGAIAYWLYYSSQKLLLKTENDSKESLISAFNKQPDFVWVKKNDIEIEIPFDHLQVGDIVVINAGETIPADGIIEKGIASIDQHILTGESQTAEKSRGEPVFASTILLAGKIDIKVEKAGKETVAAKIGEILSSTIDFKTSIQSKGQKMADDSVLPTLVSATLAFPVAGMTGTTAILFSCIGDNVRIISPLSVLNFLHIASEKGILIKDGRVLELLNEVDTVVFDKTGTLTQEQPHIGKIHTLSNYQENKLLKYAAAAEYKQKHPIAKAIIQAAKERKLKLPKIETAEYEIGYGIKVIIKKKLIRVGSIRFMEMEGIKIPNKIQTIIKNCHELGHSLVMVAMGEQLMGTIELHATIRPEVKGIIDMLRQRNISIYIISGDHEKPTQQLAQQLGIEHYFANTLPENKAILIQQLMDSGKVVCFVGDGINDSIALKKAHVSISLQGASTVATDTAQIILMDGSLKHLENVFDLATQLEKNLNTGLVTTIIPGLIVFGGVFMMNLGIVASIVMFNTGLFVGVTNAMLPLYNHRKNRKKKKK